MVQVLAEMEKLDLRNAEQTVVTGRHVWKLQVLLNAWLRAADTPAHEQPPRLLDTDGLGGPRTRHETLRFQAAHHLAEDAVVGPLTWTNLFEFDLEQGG